MPWNFCDASWMMVSISCSSRNEKPCKTAHRNVPPGGSSLGLPRISGGRRTSVNR